MKGTKMMGHRSEGSGFCDNESIQESEAVE